MARDGAPLDDLMLQLKAITIELCTTVKVATWNLHNLTMRRSSSVQRDKFDNIWQEILRSGADIIVIQEVSDEAAITDLKSRLTLESNRQGPHDQGWCCAVRSVSRRESAAFLWRQGTKLRLPNETLTKMRRNRPEGNLDRSPEANHNQPPSPFCTWQYKQSADGKPPLLHRSLYGVKFEIIHRYTSGHALVLAELNLFSVHLRPGKFAHDEVQQALPPLLDSISTSIADAQATKYIPQLIAVAGDFNIDSGMDHCAVLKQDCRLRPLLSPGTPTNRAGNNQFDNIRVPKINQWDWTIARWSAATAKEPQPAGVPYSNHRLVSASCTVGMVKTLW